MSTWLQQTDGASRQAAKEYICEREIPQLFESLTAGLLFHRPDDPITFLQDCLSSLRPADGNIARVRWNSFVDFTSQSKPQVVISTPRSSITRLPPKTLAPLRPGVYTQQEVSVTRPLITQEVNVTRPLITPANMTSQGQHTFRIA